MAGIPLHGLDEVRNEIVPALELRRDARTTPRPPVRAPGPGCCRDRRPPGRGPRRSPGRPVPSFRSPFGPGPSRAGAATRPCSAHTVRPMVAEARERRKRRFCYHDRQDRRATAGIPMRQRVLIVEDDALARKGMADLLSLWGYEVATAGDGAEALERVSEESPAVVVSDLVMPGMDGLGLLSALRVDHPDVAVIMLTGQGSIESAVQAMKEGAYDYLTKPLDPARLQVLLERALDRAESAREVHRLRRELRHRGAFGRLVAGAPAMQEVTRQIEQVAPTDATVLVLGESGTGKELVARTIHDHSSAPPRAVRRRELRGDPGDPARERDLRTREGLVHRRHGTPPRLLRARRRRHALPRRDRRDEPGHPGEVPSGSPGRAVPAGRRASRRSRSTSA